jgi:hypothetical protein
MIVYNYTPEGLYRDSEEAILSPLENGVFLIPAGATRVKPPGTNNGFHSVWNGSEWLVLEIPKPPIINTDLPDILNP